MDTPKLSIPRDTVVYAELTVEIKGEVSVFCFDEL